MTIVPNACAVCDKPMFGHRYQPTPGSLVWHSYRAPSAELTRQRIATGEQDVADPTARDTDSDLREPPIRNPNTQATVFATLTPPSPPPVMACSACDLPSEGHGVRYAALEGPHEWVHPNKAQIEQRRRAAGVLTEGAY